MRATALSRLRTCRAAVLAAVLVTLPALVPAQTTPGAQGLTSRDAMLGWEAVGRVDLAAGGGAAAGFCTGTLIAPDLVLTAAHCLFDGGRPRDPATITFRAGLAGGRALAEARAAAAVAHPAYRPASRPTADSVRHDVALLRLAAPIPAGLAAPFSVDAAAAGDEVSVLSYAKGREDVLSRERLCRVTGRAEGLHAFDCDVTFGASGAPVFQRTGPGGGGRMRIVSIIAAGADPGLSGQRLSFGPDLPEAVAALKRALVTGRNPAMAAPAVATAAAPPPQVRRLGAADTSRDTSARFLRPKPATEP